jgi:hypothetical protein
MRRRAFRIALLIGACLSIGCAPFWIDVTIEPRNPDSQSAALTQDERSTVLATVSDTASAFGLEKSTRVDGPDGLKEATGAGEHWSYQILALYRRADEKTRYSRVAITVRRTKATDAISVHIIDRDGDSYELFTKDLEAALTSALASALPLRWIVVKRR